MYSNTITNGINCRLELKKMMLDKKDNKRIARMVTFGHVLTG
jgi:hypothetical protein